MKSKNKYYSYGFKRIVVEEVLSGKLSKEQARKKYELGGKSAVLNWMRKFGLSEYRQMPASFEPMKEVPQTNDAALAKRIKELERALEDAQLKAEGYSRMIDIAERELKISIRKKSSTKQSGK
jgi:transposase-like protein